MKKLIVLVLALVCMLGLVGCIKNVETMYIHGIMVDGVFYEKSYQPMPGEVDESAIIGYIESYSDTIPTKDGETNISKDLIDSPYAKVEGGIAILYENEWYLCVAEAPLAFENTETANLYTGNQTEKEENTVRDNFSIVSSALFAGDYARSENTYMIESEKDFLIYSMNWSPTGQSVHIGFMSKEDNALYLLDDVAGGSSAGTINTVNVPSGEYYVIVFAASDNTEPFSINATCEWTE